jgi:uncharacterized protein YecT (DUF1311 family)
VRVHPNKIRDSYQTALKDYRHQLELKCAQHHIQLVDADIEQGYNEILKTYLIKRNSMI